MRDLDKGLQLLGPDDYRRMRWKNGQGWTTEIAVSPADAGLNGKPFDWRISMADIEQDGEFSPFPGYDRTILVAEGAGMELTFDASATQRLAARFEPLRFKGEWHTRCRLLDGPVRDFNVMSARVGWQQDCRIEHGSACTLAPGAARIMIVHCLQGGAGMVGTSGTRTQLQIGETLIYAGTPAAEPLELVPADAAAVMAVIVLKRVHSD